MATQNITEQRRVMLWGVPRTLSTAITKCMSFVEGSQIVIEPYNSAYHFGPEKVPLPAPLAGRQQQNKQRFESVPIEGLQHAFQDDVCTYAWAKEHLLETEYPGKSLIFCKDMAYGLQGKYDMLPEGYHHTFLIRHPNKVFRSWKKTMAPFAQKLFSPEFRFCDLPSFIIPSKYGFQEQFELYQYIKTNIDSSPVVIDADDLLSNPKSVLGKYCSEVGIAFSDDLLEWPSGLEVVKKWKASLRMLRVNLLHEHSPFGAALQSTCFNPPKDVPRTSDLSEDILQCVEASMPYYQQMYEMRLKLETF